MSTKTMKAEKLDLSEWTVEFRRTSIGWVWRAEHADGRKARPVNPLDTGLYAEKSRAETAALRAIEAAEGHDGSESVCGSVLQDRVAAQT
jgi:hypothetical protein